MLTTTSFTDHLFPWNPGRNVLEPKAHCRSAGRWVETPAGFPPTALSLGRKTAYLHGVYAWVAWFWTKRAMRWLRPPRRAKKRIKQPAPRTEAFICVRLAIETLSVGRAPMQVSFFCLFCLRLTRTERRWVVEFVDGDWMIDWPTDLEVTSFAWWFVTLLWCRRDVIEVLLVWVCVLAADRDLI